MELEEEEEEEKGREGLEEMGLLLRRSLSKSRKGIKVSMLWRGRAHIHIKQEEESGLKTKCCRRH